MKTKKKTPFRFKRRKFTPKQMQLLEEWNYVNRLLWRTGILAEGKEVRRFDSLETQVRKLLDLFPYL